MTDIDASFSVMVLRTGTNVWSWRLSRDEQVLAAGTAPSADLACEGASGMAQAITEAIHSSGNGKPIVRSGHEPSRFDWNLTITNGFRNWERI